MNGSIDHATLNTLLNPTLADTLQEFLATYLTARRKNPHWFCKNCGSTLGTDLAWLMENILVNENVERHQNQGIEDPEARGDEGALG
jgi:hypothetical protein